MSPAVLMGVARTHVAERDLAREAAELVAEVAARAAREREIREFVEQCRESWGHA